MRVSEGLKPFGAIKMTLNSRSVNLGAKRELYERVVVLTVTYGAENWCMRTDETLARCYRK